MVKDLELNKNYSEERLHGSEFAYQADITKQPNQIVGNTSHWKTNYQKAFSSSRLKQPNDSYRKAH